MRSTWKGEEPAEGASDRRSGARLGSARSSPWRVDDRPRRARREVAPCGGAEILREEPGTGKGWGRGEDAASGRRRRRAAVNGVTTGRQRREMEVMAKS